MNLQDSFRYHVDAAGCWIWDGYCDSNGYARIYDREKREIVWAHRYSYELHKRPIEPRREIDHVCQVTRCVNPAHLDQVTRPEHARRTMQRLGKDEKHKAAAHLRRLGMTYSEIAEAVGYTGRGSAGQAVRTAIEKGLIGVDEIPAVQKLTEIECDDIRTLWAMGVPQPVIAEFYGIHNSHVSRICNHKRHMPRKAKAA